MGGVVPRVLQHGNYTMTPLANKYYYVEALNCEGGRGGGRGGGGQLYNALI